MKKLLLYIILISYTALLFKPVMPYVSDFADHVFFYAKHMATVHAENGQWHVHFETAQSTRNDTEKESNLPSSSKKENTDTGYCLVFGTGEQQFGNAGNQLPWPLKNDGLVNRALQKHYPPPRC